MQTRSEKERDSKLKSSDCVWGSLHVMKQIHVVGCTPRESSVAQVMGSLSPNDGRVSQQDKYVLEAVLDMLTFNCLAKEGIIPEEQISNNIPSYRSRNIGVRPPAKTFCKPVSTEHKMISMLYGKDEEKKAPHCRVQLRRPPSPSVDRREMKESPALQCAARPLRSSDRFRVLLGLFGITEKKMEATII